MTRLFRVSRLASARRASGGWVPDSSPSFLVRP